MQGDLFGGSLGHRERVLMSLDQEWLELMFDGGKRHEFRKRFVTGEPTTWYVYLTAPASRLAAVIDLDPAVIGTADEIAAIAEQTRAGNGASVAAYLREGGGGVALPIRHVREYNGVSAAELGQRLGKWHPPQGYTRVDQHPELAAVCDALPDTGLVREITIEHPVPAA